MDKIIVTSLRVNKNQRKFAPSLKKVKKNRNKKVEKDQKKVSTDKDTKDNVNNENNSTINNSVSDTQLSLNKTLDSVKDSVVIKKLDTLKESRFFGISQTKVTPKKNSNSNTRLKLLAEVQDEQLNIKSDVENDNNNDIQNNIIQQNDTQTTNSIPTLELVKNQDQLSSNDNTLKLTPVPIMSPSKSQTDTQNDTISSSPLKDKLDNTAIPQSNTLPSTPKNDVESLSPQGTSSPITPVTSNDNTRINTPQTVTKTSQSPQNIFINSTSTTTAPTHDTISSKELEQKIQMAKISMKDSPLLAIPTSVSTSPSPNKITSDNETVNTLKINPSQDLKARHPPILSQQQNSPNRKRKMENQDSGGNDNSVTYKNVSKKRKFTIEIPIEPKKKILSDLKDDTFELLNSKLNKLIASSNTLKNVSNCIDKMDKQEKSKKNDDADVTSNSSTSEFDDSTYTGSDSEVDNIMDDIEDEKFDIDDKNDSDYQEPSKRNKKSRVKKSQLDDDDMDSLPFKSFKEFSEIEKIEEPIVFNKRTLADIIDNYHGKERSNIQKEKYKIAARKRKATLRKKRLGKLAAEGGIIDSDDLEPSIEIKRETAPLRRLNENIAAVQMRVVNGEVVVDQSSLFINHIDTSNELPITMEESRDQQVTSLSFKKNSNRSKKWKKDETDLFYQVSIYIYIYIYKLLFIFCLKIYLNCLNTKFYYILFLFFSFLFFFFFFLIFFILVYFYLWY